MPVAGTITPSDLIDCVTDILDRHPDQWMAPGDIWEEVCRVRPDLGELVDYRVSRYKDPLRNNAVWFVSTTLYHVAKQSGYTMSDIKAVPEMKERSLWLVIRKENPPG